MKSDLNANWHVLRRIAFGAARYGAYCGSLVTKAALPLIVAGCVATNPIPTQDLLSGLNASQVAPSADGELDTGEDLQNQLADTEPTTPSEAATEEVAEGGNNTDSKVPVPKGRPQQQGEQAQPAAVANATPPAAPVVTESQPTPPPKPKPNNLLASLFGNANKPKPPSVVGTNTNTTARSGVTRRPKVIVSTRSPKNRSALPGVKTKGLFGIFSAEKRIPDLDEPIELASVSNLARRGNFGLLLQTSKVQVHCFPPSLVRLLKRVERHFGRTPIVTSGYRSRSKNRRIRGARNSTHISCKAADIQVKGISKWQLAKYLRSLPGRGGVGTYCHTNSVHIDVGKKRDWNWRCRRSKRRRA